MAKGTLICMKGGRKIFAAPSLGSMKHNQISKIHSDFSRIICVAQRLHVLNTYCNIKLYA